MLGRGIIPVCMICGEPSKRIMSDRYGSYCSFRCRMIGNRKRQIVLFIFLVVGVIITSVIASSNGQWLYTIIFAATTPIPIIGYILGRRYYKEHQQTSLLRIKNSEPEDSILCEHCGKYNPIEYLYCLYCNMPISKKIKTSQDLSSQNSYK